MAGLNGLFLIAAIIHLALLLSTLSLRPGIAEWIVRALLLGLLIDNITLALSIVGLGESWYVLANQLRYAAHAILLPLLLVAGVLLARRAGVLWTLGRKAVTIASVLAAIGILFGLASEVYGLTLVPETLFGHTRLVSNSGLPPIATILTNLLLLPVGLATWRCSGWPWLFVVTLLILLINGATGALDWGIISGNTMEIVFAIGWIATLRRFPVERG
jgi:hypothetical protein